MIAGGRRLDVDCARAPQPPVLWALVLAGFAAAGCTFALALGSDHVNEPGLQAALMSWITLPYVFAGVIAWWRRPDSRFGLLMVDVGRTLDEEGLDGIVRGVVGHPGTLDPPDDSVGMPA